MTWHRSHEPTEVQVLSAEVEVLVDILEEFRKHNHTLKHISNVLSEKPEPGKAVKGRFAGAYFINPKTGDIILAVQTLPASTAVTAPIIFTDSTGAAVKGPTGTLTVDNPAVTDARLSADFQSCNVTTPASGSVTITWTDPAANIAPFSVTLTDQILPVTITGQFGTFAPGTTA